MTCRWGDFPGLSRWALKHRRRKQRRQSDVLWEGFSWPLLALKTEGCHEPRNEGNPQKPENARNRFSPLSLWKEVVLLIPWSVQSLSHVQLFATPWTAACQASLSITNFWSLLKLISIELMMPSNHLIPSPPAPNPSQHQGLFQWVNLSHEVAKVLEFQLQHQSSVLPMNTQDWSPLGWTSWISFQSKGLSKESSPTPQFKSINSLVLSFLYSPTLTSIQDYWKNDSFD